MQAPATISPTLQTLVDRILDSRRITRFDQRALLALRTLNPEEQSLVNLLFDRLHKGFLRVVD
jgi:hypothetical protein